MSFPDDVSGNWSRLHTCVNSWVNNNVRDSDTFGESIYMNFCGRYAVGKKKETFNKRLHIYLVLSIFGFIIHFIFKQLGSDIHKYNGIYSLGLFPNIHVVFERRLLIWFKANQINNTLLYRFCISEWNTLYVGEKLHLRDACWHESMFIAKQIISYVILE